MEEPRFISEQLQSDYYEYSDRGHFIEPDECEFSELVEAVLEKLRGVKTPLG